jgi:multidrug resistance efflux pump
MKMVFKTVLTLVVILSAAYFGYKKYELYINNPWTRDGQVRTQVIQIAPRVSGMVTKIYVKDNEHVQKGDLLFEIDSSMYKFKVAQAKAALKRVREVNKGAKVEYNRLKVIYKRDKGAVSQKDLIRNEVNYNKSLADIDAAKEKLNIAKLNLSFTEVRAEVEGWVSNINFQLGTQAVANKPIMALVDKNSFWVFGFFREDMIKNIQEGDEAIVTLMAYPDKPIKGRVESIAWGIYNTDANPGANLLPNVKPVFEWIRLAQRIPVRVELEDFNNSDIVLRYGMSASVLIKEENEK